MGAMRVGNASLDSAPEHIDIGAAMSASECPTFVRKVSLAVLLGW